VAAVDLDGVEPGLGGDAGGVGVGADDPMEVGLARAGPSSAGSLAGRRTC
jgi:hypothetical protein